MAHSSASFTSLHVSVLAPFTTPPLHTCPRTYCPHRRHRLISWPAQAPVRSASWNCRQRRCRLRTDLAVRSGNPASLSFSTTSAHLTRCISATIAMRARSSSPVQRIFFMPCCERAMRACDDSTNAVNSCKGGQRHSATIAPRSGSGARGGSVPSHRSLTILQTST